MDPQFAAGIALTVFGALLVMMGVMLPDFSFVLFPVAVVFIGSGVALKIISVRNLG